MMNDKLYTISEVAEKLNLSTKTLRRWENEGKFTASRTIGGQRRYTLEDLQILDAIKHGTITSKSDLLTLQQAANLFGVTPQTIIRWENEGKIHPFITSGNTYYPKSRLIEKIESLKKTLNPPEPPLDPTPPPPSSPTPPTPTPPPSPSPTPLTPTNSLPRHFLLTTITINLLLTFFLLLGYHLATSSKQTQPPSTTQSPTLSSQTPLQKTLQAIFSLTGDLETPGSITTKKSLTVGQTLNLLPTTPPLKPTPGTIYFDASTQTLKLFTKNRWLDFPNPNLSQPQNTTLASATAILPKNKTLVQIQNPAITPQTTILITFTSDYSPARKYWLTQKPGQFTLHTDFPPSQNATFTYLLINPNPSPTENPQSSSSATISTPNH